MCVGCMSNSVFVCVRDCLWYVCNTFGSFDAAIAEAIAGSLCAIVCMATLLKQLWRPESNVIVVCV